MGVRGPEGRNFFIGGVRNLISTVSGPTINDLMMPNLVTRGFILSLGSGSVVVLFHVIDGRVLISSLTIWHSAILKKMRHYHDRYLYDRN